MEYAGVQIVLCGLRFGRANNGLDTRSAKLWCVDRGFMWNRPLPRSSGSMAYHRVELIVDDHPNYQHYAHRLSPGWMFGRQVVSAPSVSRCIRRRVQSRNYKHQAVRRISGPAGWNEGMNCI